MESIYPELALCGSKNECARTNLVFLHLSEDSEGTVSLSKSCQTGRNLTRECWQFLQENRLRKDPKIGGNVPETYQDPRARDKDYEEMCGQNPTYLPGGPVALALPYTRHC